MRDNELIQLFVPIIRAGLDERGLTNVLIEQANQPTQQGANSAPTVLFTKLFDHPYGFVEMNDAQGTVEGETIHTEIQNLESTFQISALVTQNPADTTSLTASDIVNTVAAIMRSEITRGILQAGNVGIQKPGNVRNPYFVDDRGRFEAVPSFDFILTHKQIDTNANPVIQSVNSGIYPI